MATSRIVLPIPGGVWPDGTTGNVAMRPEKIKSAGTAPTNGPSVFYVHLLADQSTDQHWMWTFVLPGDWVSGGTLRFKWGAKVTTGNVIWKAAQSSATDSSTDMDTSSVFDTVVTTAATAVPGTVGQVKELTLTLTGTGMAANREMIVMIGRDADNASDTAAGDATLDSLIFEYTS